MPKDYRVYLDDILEAIEKIRDYIELMSFDSFYNDPKTIDAVNRNLGVIGEAANRLTDEIRCKYPNIEWHRIIALRNIIIHDYASVDLEIIWDIVKNKLSLLEKQVKEILKN